MGQLHQKWRSVREGVVENEYPDNTIITSRYTVLTFLPKSILEQFRKKTNIFFLAMSILMIVLPVPSDPTSYILTFLGILSVSIFKSLYEDWLRHKLDNEVNNKQIKVFVSQQLSETGSRRLRVGDIVRLEENENVPCDVLVLAAISQTGKLTSRCELTTANLDGEPNMKVRVCPIRLDVQDPVNDIAVIEAIRKGNISVECEPPSADLYMFSGDLTTSQDMANSVALSMDNMLLRGTTVKHVQYVYGLIIYTGMETRLSQNLSLPKLGKFSVIDLRINRLISLMICVHLTLATVGFGLFYFWITFPEVAQAWYVPQYLNSDLLLGVETMFIWFVSLGTFIPIALSASVESTKILCRLYFGWDNEMNCGKGNSAVCNNSDVVDELGQIDYLLTDKTGTLTENNLKFKCCSFGGSTYDYKTVLHSDEFVLEETEIQISKNEISADRLEFLEAIALCHTVQAVVKSDGVNYQGTSSDEEVLVEAAHTLGVTYTGDDENRHMTIGFKDAATRRYIRHLVFEFDAERKCMSVVVEDDDNRIFLISKGAETSILPKCTKHTSAYPQNTSSNHVSTFAKQGYRTLVIGKREISMDELNRIKSTVESLRRSPSELAQVYEQVETSMRLIGVTGVEDKLQQNVPKTLAELKLAGIRIWVLTGDKLETALNISSTCGLIHKSCSDLCTDENSFRECTTHLTKFTSSDELQDALQKLQTTSQKTLVIDSATFKFGYEESRKLFASVAMSYSQIIFCRMTPLQKAQVVDLIKTTNQNVRVCAVGDGGNDVAMIQHAHVGIGILGKEGRQAARAADFAIPRFEHLSRSILVHGHWNYYRIAVSTMYLIYRSFPMSVPQFIYGFQTAFSAMPVYEGDFTTYYSILISNIPLICFVVTEKSMTAKTLMNNPTLYGKNRNNKFMNLEWTAYWIFIGIWQSITVGLLPSLILTETIVYDRAEFCHLINSLLVIVTDIKILMTIQSFNWSTAIGQVVCLGSMFLIYTLTSEVFGTGALKFAYYRVIGSGEFWLILLLIAVLSMLPDLILNVFKLRSFKNMKVHCGKLLNKFQTRP